MSYSQQQYKLLRMFSGLRAQFPDYPHHVDSVFTELYPFDPVLRVFDIREERQEPKPRL
jgi:hypothetical protein